MATCRVKRNDNGRITKVNNENGSESRLFNDIAAHPMVENEEEALRIFKNTLTNKAEGAIDFIHRVNGELVLDYKNALKKANEGDKIELGFYLPSEGGNFVSIVDFNKTTDKSTKEGFINYMIEFGALSPTKKRTKDGFKYQSAGNTENAKVVNAEIIRDTARAYLGVRGLGKDGSTFKLDKTNDKTQVLTHEGTYVEMTRDEIAEMSYKDLQKITPYALDFIISREVANNRPAYGYVQPEKALPNRTEEELKLHLLNLLNKMGVSTMSISQYVEKFKVKNGVDPSVEALADISNKVIAFNNGEMGLEALTEEVAHFITEAMPQEQIEEVLRNIHKSEEWNEHAEAYRDVYSKSYQGAELENAVRREVLGKVMTNAILSEFNTQGKTAEQTGFIETALNILQKFFERIQAYFRPQYKQELDSYLDSVKRLVTANEIADRLNTDNFEGNKMVLFSMSRVPKSSIGLSAEKAVSALRDQIQHALSRAKKGSSLDRQKLQDIQEKLEQAEEVGAVADITSLTDTYITMLAKAIEDAEKHNKSFVFTQEENVIFQSLKLQLVPSLREINALIKNKKGEYSADWRKLEKDISDTIRKYDDLEGSSSKVESVTISNLIDKIMVRHELPENKRKYIEKWVEEADSDTNWFHANFGMLTHSKDGLLNLAGMLQKDIATQSNIKWQDSTKKYQQRLKQLGISEKDVSKFIDGNFIVSDYDFNKFEEVLERLEAITYKEVTDSKLSVEEIIEAKLEGTLEPLTSAQETEQKRKLKDLRNPLLERKFKSDYYDKFEQKLATLGISEYGVRFIMNYYGDMSQFKRAANKVIKDSNGNDKQIMDFSQLSEQDKALRDKLIKNRGAAKSYYGENGTLKEGLEIDHKTGEIVPSGKIPLSKDAQIALDLHKLDDPKNRDKSLNTESAGIPQIFLDTIREIESTEGREAALDFLRMNSFIGFTKEYWDKILDVDGKKGILDRLQEYSEANPQDRTAAELFRDIRNDKAQLKEILKVFRSKNNPSEIDVDSMPRVSRDTVKTIQQRLMNRYRNASTILKNMPREEKERLNISESSVNDAYYKKLEDLDISITENDSREEVKRKLEEETEFAMEHMTDENKADVTVALQTLKSFLAGSRETLDPNLQRIADELGYEVANIGDAEVTTLTQELLRRRLLPYYTRFAPEQYNSFMGEITTGQGNLADIIPNLTSRYNYMEINPNYSFFDESQNENMNPNYVENFEGGYLQPKKDLSDTAVKQVLNRIGIKEERSKVEELINRDGKGFRSNKYKELFGGKTDSNLYKAYEATLEYNRDHLTSMGVGNSYNFYTKPQVKSSRMERFSKFTKGASLEQIKEAMNDEFTYTEDDKIQGETNKFGDAVKIIPKMYTDRLENPKDASDELFYSLTLRAKEAYLREARVEHYGDFMAIYDKIQNRTYKGKDAKPENTLKMFESAMDYSLFGIKETAMYPIETMFGTIDVAKLARKLLSFIKFRNLGLNLIIPITSYLTGRGTREIEKWVGEHMDTRSQKLGDAEFRKHAGAAMKEIGEINTESKLAVMGQYFQAFDMAESFQNSNYGYWLRLLPRTGMMAHTGANFPIYGSTLFGILHDFRLINGSIMRFNQFQTQQLAEGLSKQEIKDKWDSMEDKAIYKFMDVENGEMKFHDSAIRSELLNKDGNPMTEAEYEPFMKEKIQAIRGHVSNVITNIDGQIPQEARVFAQRHFALNYFMTHRGWLSIVASRRFKNRHLNVETGEVEEGSYRTVWNFMGRYFKEYKKSNFKDFTKSWKKAFDDIGGAQLTNEVQILAKSKGSNADRVKKIKDLFKDSEFDIKPYDLNENNIDEVTEKIIKDIKTSGETSIVRRNMKRVGIEMAALNGLMLIGFLLNGMADDDEWEDNYAIQGVSYLSNRTLNELSSAQLGSINNFSEVIESPFVGWSTVKTFTDVGDLFNGDAVKHGTYAGISERQRFLTKLVPGVKQYYDLSSAERVKKMRDTYMFYNNANFNYSPLGNLYWLGESEE